MDGLAVSDREVEGLGLAALVGVLVLEEGSRRSALGRVPLQENSTCEEVRREEDT